MCLRLPSLQKYNVCNCFQIFFWPNKRVLVYFHCIYIVPTAKSPDIILVITGSQQQHFNHSEMAGVHSNKPTGSSDPEIGIGCFFSGLFQVGA